MRAAAVRWRDDVRHLLVSLGLAVVGYGVLVLVATSAGLGLLGGRGLSPSARAAGLARQLTDRQRTRSGVKLDSSWSGATSAAAEQGGGVRAAGSGPVTSRELLWLASPVQAGFGLL